MLIGIFNKISFFKEIFIKLYSAHVWCFYSGFTLFFSFLQVIFLLCATSHTSYSKNILCGEIKIGIYNMMLD